MSGIKCTKCGHVMDKTQAITQIGTKTLRDVYKLNVAACGIGNALDSVLAGCATETKIKCPKCDSVSSFVPASKDT
jgi:phage FluMu protein Com